MPVTQPLGWQESEGINKWPGLRKVLDQGFINSYLQPPRFPASIISSACPWLIEEWTMSSAHSTQPAGSHWVPGNHSSLSLTCVK